MKVFRKIISDKKEPILDNVGMGVKRKALHVEETGCNNCGLIFLDKYEDKDYSNHDAGKKYSYGTHKVECPYCGHINARYTAYWDQVKERGQYRDFSGDMKYGTRFGMKPPIPKKVALQATADFYHKVMKKV